MKVGYAEGKIYMLITDDRRLRKLNEENEPILEIYHVEIEDYNFVVPEKIRERLREGTIISVVQRRFNEYHKRLVIVSYVDETFRSDRYDAVIMKVDVYGNARILGDIFGREEKIDAFFIITEKHIILEENYVTKFEDEAELLTRYEKTERII